MSVSARAEAEGRRLLEAARLRNERSIWGLIGPLCLISTVVINHFRASMSVATPPWLVGGLLVLGILYTALYLTWRKPVPVAMATTFVTIEAIAAFLLLAGDASVDLNLARETSGQLAPFMVVVLAGLRLRGWLAIYGGVLGAAGFAAAYPVLCNQVENFYCAPSLFMWRPVLIVVASVVVALTVRSSQRTFARAQKELLNQMSVRNTLGQLVSEDVAETLMHSKGLQGARREATVAFIDLRNFTSYCAGRDAADVVRNLNLILGELIEVVQAHNGVVNKFLGDGMLVIFGVPTDNPNHAQDALEAGLQAVEKMATLSANLDAPSLQLGVGIHSGEVVAGTIGSDERMEYTVIGDTVNLASRIEGLNRSLRTTVLISAETQKRLCNPGIENARDCGLHQVKGRDQAVHLFAYGPPLKDA